MSRQSAISHSDVQLGTLAQVTASLASHSFSCIPLFTRAWYAGALGATNMSMQATEGVVFVAPCNLIGSMHVLIGQQCPASPNPQSGRGILSAQDGRGILSAHSGGSILSAPEINRFKGCADVPFVPGPNPLLLSGPPRRKISRLYHSVACSTM